MANPQKNNKKKVSYLFDSNTPSKITKEYWVLAFVKQQIKHKHKFKNNKTGKWLIFVNIKELDSTWLKIKQATEMGILGLGAKCATAKPNPHATSENEKVICVYTYNWQDVEDVYRIEKSLRTIGIDSVLYYKTDEGTLDGNYKINNSTNISKYISKSVNSFKKFDIGSLNGIGYEKIDILNKIGIKNFDDLLMFDTTKKIENRGISREYINKMKIYALSQIENKIYKLKPVQIPTKEIVHFDIETDLTPFYNTKKIWSIATHYNNKVSRFYANTWEKENKILKDFLNFIKKIKNPSLISYSGVGFDKNILSAALKRHSLDSDYFINCNHYDLCSILKQNYVLPVKSYGLKEIAKYFGYKFSNDNMDGRIVALRYLQCQYSGEKLPKEIFQYIDDDVKAMDFIIKQLDSNQTIKDLFDYSPSI